MKNTYEKFNIETLKKENILLPLEVLISFIKISLINENGNFSPWISSNLYYKKYQNEYYSIWYRTKFLDETVHFRERLFCIINLIENYKLCTCGKTIKKMTTQGKYSNWFFNKYCSYSCSTTYTNTLREKEVYNKISKNCVVTRTKNKSYKIPDNLWTDEARLKRKETNVLKYGVENPGVLGAYSSKAARNYIKNYLIENNIYEGRVYYSGGGVNGKEFFQSINKKYFSYDLIIFKNEEAAKKKDLEKIEMVLEYNGSWHYKLEDVIFDPEGLATPYPNSLTKKEVYEKDEIKLNHVYKFCNNIQIYWEKTKEIEKWKN